MKLKAISPACDKVIENEKTDEINDYPAFYRAKAGETFQSISAKFAIPLSVVLRENDGVKLNEGVTVFLPAKWGKTYVVKPTDTLSSVSKKFGIPESELVKKNGITYVYPSLILELE